MSINPPFPNTYTLRTVAEVSSKPCLVCHRPTAKVLTSPGNKDFLYTCPSHLKDPHFATPVPNPAADAARLKADTLQREKEEVIREYEEKMKGKKGWLGGWIGGGEKKDGRKEGDGSEKKGEEEREKDEKLKALDAKATAKTGGTTPGIEEPREYTLHRNFYQMRVDRVQNIERAKREQARLQDPTFFPSAPKGELG